MNQIASEEMVKEALGDEMEEMAEPPMVTGNKDHPLWGAVVMAIREVYDPEIPVNIYELGLIYDVQIDDANNIKIMMSLTAPGCPVAGEMPGMVSDSIEDELDDIGDVDVEITWEPAWDPSRMAETAKLTLNMF